MTDKDGVDFAKSEMVIRLEMFYDFESQGSGAGSGFEDL